MDIRAEFTSSMKEAMKSKDEIGLSTTRLIMAALKDRDIAARAKGNVEGIPESDILSMLQSMIKQRGESMKTYSEAGREDLAEREEKEIDIIQKFMPQQLGEDEVKAAVAELIEEIGATDVKDMGRVMAELKTRYAGKLDMGKASAMVKESLN